MASTALAPEIATRSRFSSDPAKLFADIADRYRLLLFAMLAVFYLVGFNGQWQLEPDSALYLTLGRNLALGRGYTYHGLPHDLAYPGVPYALAAIFRIFPNHAIAAADALMLLCGWATIACTYRLVRLAFDRPTAVVVALGLGVSHELFRYCYEIMTDVPFAAAVTAFLAGYQGLLGPRTDGKRGSWPDALLLIVGLLVSAFTRPTMIGLLFAVLAALIWTVLSKRTISKRKLLLAGAAMVAVAGLFLLGRMAWPNYNFLEGGGDYETFAFSALTQNLKQQLTEQVPANLKDMLGLTAARAFFGVPLGTWWLNAFFGCIPILAALWLLKKQAVWGLWVFATLVMMALLVSHDRYLLQILPLMVLGWWRWISAIGRRLPQPWGSAIFAVLLTLSSVANLSMSGLVVYDQRYTPYLSRYKGGRMVAYVQAAQCLATDTPPGAIIASPPKMSRILTFLSDRNVQEEDEYQGGTAEAKWYILVDRDDQHYLHFLKRHSIFPAGAALELISRGQGKTPLELMRAGKKN